MSRKAPTVVSCPACDAEIRFRKAPYVGQYKICSDCDTELEVLSLSPIELDYVDGAEDAYHDNLDELDSLGDEDEYAHFEPVRVEPMRRPVFQTADFDLDD